MSSKSQKLALLAAGLGVVSGLRSMSGPAALSFMLARDPKRVDDTPFKYLARFEGQVFVVFCALGEFVGDQLPFAQARIKPIPLAIRLLLGGFAGAGLFAWEKRSAVQGALFGAAGAFVGSHAGYNYRVKTHELTGIPDLPLALAEDVATVLLGRELVKLADQED